VLSQASAYFNKMMRRLNDDRAINTTSEVSHRARRAEGGLGPRAVGRCSCQPDTCRLVRRPVLFDDTEQDRVAAAIGRHTEEASPQPLRRGSRKGDRAPIWIGDLGRKSRVRPIEFQVAGYSRAQQSSYRPDGS
jgi:hypothetical protein